MSGGQAHPRSRIQLTHPITKVKTLPFKKEKSDTNNYYYVHSMGLTKQLALINQLLGYTHLKSIRKKEGRKRIANKKN